MRSFHRFAASTDRWPAKLPHNSMLLVSWQSERSVPWKYAFCPTYHPRPRQRVDAEVSRQVQSFSYWCDVDRSGGPVCAGFASANSRNTPSYGCLRSNRSCVHGRKCAKARGNMLRAGLQASRPGRTPGATAPRPTLATTSSKPDTAKSEHVENRAAKSGCPQAISRASGE